MMLWPKAFVLLGLFVSLFAFVHSSTEPLSFAEEEDDVDEVILLIHLDGMDSLSDLLELGITNLDHPSKESMTVEAFVTREQVKLLQHHQFRFEKLPNAAREYHEELKRSTGGTLDHYHNYDELSAFLEQMENEYPQIARRFSIGQSVQGREIWGIRITDNIGSFTYPLLFFFFFAFFFSPLLY